MTEMTVLQVAGIVEGSERLANEIARAGITPQTFLHSTFCSALEKRLEELRSIDEVKDLRMQDLLRRKQIVYGRLSALLTTYQACAAEFRRG